MQPQYNQHQILVVTCKKSLEAHTKVQMFCSPSAPRAAVCLLQCTTAPLAESVAREYTTDFRNPENCGTFELPPENCCRGEAAAAARVAGCQARAPSCSSTARPASGANRGASLERVVTPISLSHRATLGRGAAGLASPKSSRRGNCPLTRVSVMWPDVSV